MLPSPRSSWVIRTPRAAAFACNVGRTLLAVVLLIAGSRTDARSADAGSELEALVDRQLAAHAAVLERSPADSPERVRRLLALGRGEDAVAAAERLPEASDPRALALARGWAYLTVQDFAAARPYLSRLMAQGVLNDEERSLRYAWLFALDDGAQVDRLSRRSMTARGATPAPDLLAAGRLAADLFQYERADSCYRSVLEGPAARPDSSARAAALRGLGVVAYRRRDFDRSLEHLQRSVALEATPAGLQALAETLVRLGKTDEAITAAVLAIRLNPWFDPAHYYLGNGYARKNYTELLAAYPGAFADGRGRLQLREGDSLLAMGKRAEARIAYEAAVRTHPGWADAHVRLASFAWEEGRFDQARDACFAALRLCPEYGRAHATLAKALESQRFLVDVHRHDYEQRFEATPMPAVPGIETFVVNWASLSPRHQKQVALSIAPWKVFIPVLVEGGSTYYIKPLYMLLSETPGQEALRDQRINYDSRLWDDVRGCGGYRTVTGIEDVERTIFDRYNTVLHELTHQVHGVLTADQNREIEEHYNRAKKRDEQTRNGFLSRYAGGSVWEYFAEGANGLESPRRDRYDTRDIVRERLTEIDPDLARLVARLFQQSDVGPSYAVAYVNAGGDRIEKGDVPGALPFYRKALDRSPREETALTSLAFALSLKGDGPAALAASEAALAEHPTSGTVVTTHADVTRHAGRGLDAAVGFLVEARGRVRAQDRNRVDTALAAGWWAAGQPAAALAAADSLLAYQSDSPEGLWLRAAALALGGRYDEAVPVYEQAVRLRTGVVDLRCDYARDLIRAGRLDAARAQLEEARLLDAEDPGAEALRGWVALAAGDPAAARTHCEAALRTAPWLDLAAILLGRARQLAGDAAGADAAWAPVLARLEKNQPPEYVYVARNSVWRSVHEFPAVERELLASFRQP